MTNTITLTQTTPVMRQIAAVSTGNLNPGALREGAMGANTFHLAETRVPLKEEKLGVFRRCSLYLEASKLRKRQNEIGREFVVNHRQQTCSNEMKTFGATQTKALGPFNSLSNYHIEYVTQMCKETIIV